MLVQTTLDTLNRLKLYGMAAALTEQMSQSAASSLAFEERLGLLVDREALYRDNRRVTRLLQLAQLKQRNACIEDIDYRPRRGLDRAQLASLASCEWIRHAQNLLIHGATGAGKTWLACALAHQACRQGLSALYLRAPRLFDELSVCHADGSFRKRLAAIAKVNVLVIDDFAIAPIGARERADLLELLDDRVGSRSTLITSQLHLDHWHDYIGEPTLADAILDRLVHSAHKIHLKGESMRQHTARGKGTKPDSTHGEGVGNID
jgi:DNA replication protein DnaC